MCGTERLGKVTASERSAEAARLLWEQEVAGSIPAAPTIRGLSLMGEHRPCTAAVRVRSPQAPPRMDGRDGL